MRFLPVKHFFLAAAVAVCLSPTLAEKGHASSDRLQTAMLQQMRNLASPTITAQQQELVVITIA